MTAPKITQDELNANIVDVEIVKHVSKGGQILRWAVLTTKSGFAVTGRPSAAVCAENDDSEIGVAVAISNAKSELWPLMGYALKEQLHLITQTRGRPTADSDDFLAGAKACDRFDPTCESCQ